MEDLTTPASNSTNANTNAIDASGLTRTDGTKGFNANVGKQNSELKKANGPVSTQTDQLKTPNTSKMGAEGLKGSDIPQSTQSAPDTSKQQSGFSDMLAKKAQGYMNEKTKTSTSQTPSGETPSPSERQNTVNPKTTDSPKSPQRPDSKIAKPSMDVGPTPNLSAPGFKPAPSIQIPKFTLPNFKR